MQPTTDLLRFVNDVFDFVGEADS